MKKFLACAFLTSLLYSLTFAQSQASDVKAELLNLDRKLNEELYNTGDVTVLGEILAADWYGMTVLAGPTYSKADMLEEIRKAKDQLHGRKPPEVKLSPADVKIYIFGDTAVVSGRLKIKLNGEDTNPAKYVNVYMNRDGKWRAVASHYCS